MLNNKKTVIKKYISYGIIATPLLALALAAPLVSVSLDKGTSTPKVVKKADVEGAKSFETQENGYKPKEYYEMLSKMKHQDIGTAKDPRDAKPASYVNNDDKSKPYMDTQAYFGNDWDYLSQWSNWFKPKQWKSLKQEKLSDNARLTEFVRMIQGSMDQDGKSNQGRYDEVLDTNVVTRLWYTIKADASAEDINKELADLMTSNPYQVLHIENLKGDLSEVKVPEGVKKITVTDKQPGKLQTPKSLVEYELNFEGENFVPTDFPADVYYSGSTVFKVIDLSNKGTMTNEEVQKEIDHLYNVLAKFRNFQGEWAGGYIYRINLKNTGITTLNNLNIPQQKDGRPNISSAEFSDGEDGQPTPLEGLAPKNEENGDPKASNDGRLKWAKNKKSYTNKATGQEVPLIKITKTEGVDFSVEQLNKVLKKLNLEGALVDLSDFDLTDEQVKQLEFSGAISGYILKNSKDNEPTWIDKNIRGADEQTPPPAPAEEAAPSEKSPQEKTPSETTPSEKGDNANNGDEGEENTGEVQPAKVVSLSDEGSNNDLNRSENNSSLLMTIGIIASSILTFGIAGIVWYSIKRKKRI